MLWDPGVYPIYVMFVRKALTDFCQDSAIMSIFVISNFYHNILYIMYLIQYFIYLPSLNVFLNKSLNIYEFHLKFV